MLLLSIFLRNHSLCQKQAYLIQSLCVVQTVSLHKLAAAMSEPVKSIKNRMVPKSGAILSDRLNLSKKKNYGAATSCDTVSIVSGPHSCGSSRLSSG